MLSSAVLVSHKPMRSLVYICHMTCGITKGGLALRRVSDRIFTYTCAHTRNLAIVNRLFSLAEGWSPGMRLPYLDLLLHHHVQGIEGCGQYV